MLSLRSSVTSHALRQTSRSRPILGRGFFLSTSSRLGLKESSTETTQDFEKHKKDSLEKQKRGSGHWKPELASDSEEAVMADRQAAHSGRSDDEVRRLQERTKRAAEETAKAGTSMKDGL